MLQTENPYSPLYISISDAALLDIISRESDYQPLAVLAAKTELASRNLSAAQLADANEMLVKKETNRLQQEKKLGSITRILKYVHNLFIAGVLFLLVRQLCKPIADFSDITKIIMESSLLVVAVLVKYAQKYRR